MSKSLAEELTEFQTTLDFYRKQYAEDGMITADEQSHLDVLEGKIKRLQSTISHANTGNGNGQPLAAPGAPTNNPIGAAPGGAPVDELAGVTKVQMGSEPPVESKPVEGSGAPKGTPYPGHGPTPTGSIPKEKPKPGPSEQQGRRQAERDLNRDPSHAKSTFDESGLKNKNHEAWRVGPGGAGTTTPVDKHGQPVDPAKLYSDTELKKTQDAYLDPKNPKGKSVKDLKVVGKTADQLHHELESKGFKLQDPEGRLKDFNPQTKQMEYKLRDGSFTTDLAIAKKNGVPQYIYVHPDGGMVRVKPEGTPGNPMRNEPNISKSVLVNVQYDQHGKVVDTRFENEAFKVGDDGKITPKQPTVGVKLGPDGKPIIGPDGKPVPKAPEDAGGMRKEPRGMEPLTGDPQKDAEIRKRNEARTRGYNDVAMEKGHVPGPTSPHPTPAGSPPTPTNRQLGPGTTPDGSPTPHTPTEPSKAGDAKTLEAGNADYARRGQQIREEIIDVKKGGKSSGEIKVLQNKVEAFQNEGLVRLSQAIAADPTLKEIRGSTAAETFSNARKKIPAGSGAMVVVTSFFVVNEVVHILNAESVTEGVKRTVQFGTNFAVGTGEYMLFNYMLGSSPVAFLLTMAVGMCSDKQGSCDEQAKMKQKEAQGELDKEQARQLTMALAKIVDQRAPGSIQWINNGQAFIVKDQEAWMAAVKEVEKQRAEHMAEKQAALGNQQAAMEMIKAAMDQHARGLGIRDALTGERLHENALHPDREWIRQRKALYHEEISDEEIARDIIDDQRLWVAYRDGYQEGEVKKKAALTRAGEWGSQDGKSGKAVRTEEIRKWPELETTGLKEPEIKARAGLLAELLGIYEKAFHAAAPAGSGAPRAGGDLTYGEMVARDKKAAAQKRAREFGLKDGKTGKKTQVEDIQKWTEVTGLEGPDRAKFLAELIQIYNKAFASVAPAGAVAPAPNNVTAGELVARDKLAALLKRAAELGTKDGKTGKQSHLEELHKWPEVTQLEKAAGLALHGQLVVAYTKAFNSAAPATPVLLQRARELGQKDAKSGMALHMAEISKWPEVTKMETGVREAVLAQLVEVYRKALATGG